MSSLEELWQIYRAHIHGYDPDGEAELEAAFKSGAWAFLQSLKTQPRLTWDHVHAIEAEFEALKARRRES
jgi:hypothetical protein